MAEQECQHDLSQVVTPEGEWFCGNPDCEVPLDIDLGDRPGPARD